MPRLPSNPETLMRRGSTRLPRGRAAVRTPATSSPLTCPDYLSEAARGEWHRLHDLLAPTGVLQQTDADVLELTATTLARLREAQATVDREGLQVTLNNGVRCAHPLLAVVNTATRQLNALLPKLGLTPVDRQRLAMGTVTKTNTIGFSLS